MLIGNVNKSMNNILPKNIKLSIITVNLNNSKSLENTILSVIEQTFSNYELIIIDGGSTDGSVEIIRKFEAHFNPPEGGLKVKSKLKWVSEKDSGIYNAMNKGIEMARGEYCYFLNSGEVLYNKFVFEKVFKSNPTQSFVVGNAIMVYDYVVRVEKEPELSFGYFYKGSICHQAAFIKRSLFDSYGFYDEKLKIVSDWKFFFIAIKLKNESVEYVDVDIVFHDLYGISITQSDLYFEERRKVLEEYIPKSVLLDYYTISADLIRIKRLHDCNIANSMILFIDRCVNKWNRIVQKKNLRGLNREFRVRILELNK